MHGLQRRNRAFAFNAVRFSLFVAAGLAAVACTCESGDPEVEVILRFDNADLRAQARVFTATVSIDGNRWYRRRALPPGTSVEENEFVPLLSIPGSSRFPLSIDVAVLDDNDQVLATGSAETVGAPNACNVLLVRLGEPPSTVRDGGAPDADVRDAEMIDGQPIDGGLVDAAPPIDGGPESTVLSASPDRIDAQWVDRGPSPTFEFRISSAPVADLSGLTVTAPAPAMPMSEVVPGPDGTAMVRVSLGTLRSTGSATTELRFGLPDGTGVVVPVTYRVFRPVHVGPRDNACPHDTVDGGRSRACNYTGELGVRTAVADSDRFDHVVMHGDAGALAVYTSSGGLAIRELLWLSSAPDADPSRVVFMGENCPVERGAIQLQADGVRLNDFTLVARNCTVGVASRTVDRATGGTTDHEIERLRFLALRPEIYDKNNIRWPLIVSQNTTVSQSLMIGYWEGLGDLREAHDALLIHNTFVAYQDYGKRSFPTATSRVEGSRGLKILNNVFVALPTSVEPFVVADGSTRDLLIEGNVFRLFQPNHLTELGALNPDRNRVDTNPDVQSRLLSPIEPVFLASERPMASLEIPFTGTSLDGIPITDGRLDDGELAVPGALQERSSASNPVMSVRLGPDPCQAQGCTLSDAIEDEVQIAAWSLWPGGTLEILPSARSYAGNVMVTWPITISGAGRASDVVLEGRVENELWRRNGLVYPNGVEFWNHGAVVAATAEGAPDFVLERVTLDITPSSAGFHRGIFLEGLVSAAFANVRNTVVRYSGTPSIAPRAAIRAGWNVVVQDSLVQGPWESCVRSESNLPGTFINRQAFINITCRLTGTGAFAPLGAAAVGRLGGGEFVNWIAEANAPSAELFHAFDQGATPGTPTFTARANHHIGFGGGERSASIDPGGFIRNSVLSTSPFVSATNSRLDTVRGAPSINAGETPATPLSVWVGLDGNVRGATPDRGAYERDP